MQSPQTAGQPGYLIHPAGELSRGAVLDVGLKCVHSCKFCYYSFLDKTDDQFSGMRKASFRSLDECKEILRRLKENGFTHFDYTGGEPSLHQEIIEITRYAHQELGLKGRMITLGQFLMRRMKNCKTERLMDDLLDAGLTNFLFSTHAVEEELFHRITNESFAKLQAAMTYLDEKEFHYTSNTTVFEWNYKHLPDIAREIVKHNVYLHNFIIMNAYYQWNHDGRAFGIQAKYSDIHPYLEEAVAILESNNVGVNIRYAPLCSVKGMEKNLVGMVGVRYDPYEWMNLAGHMGGTPELCASVIPLRKGEIENHLAYQPQHKELENGAMVTGSRSDLKLFSSPCTKCEARDVCDGIDPNYLKLYGAGEFSPYAEREAAPLQKARVPYRIPFMVKLDQWVDMKAAVREEFARYRAEIEATPQTPTNTSEAPAVSVVIPCYNYGRYLREAVESVLAQTTRDFEVIIVNDGSTDNTSEVAQQLVVENPGARIRLIDQENSGQPALSRNVGISAAQGRYILCLDGDDKLAPTMLEECLAVLENDASVAIAYTDRKDFDGVEGIATADPYDFQRLRHTNHISYCALFRKEVWTAVGGYRDNVRGCEDWDFWVAAGARGFYGKHIAKPLFHYRRHDTGLFQEALQNFEARRAQIVLNNRAVYSDQEIAAAERLLAPAAEGEPDPLVSVIIPTVNRPDMLVAAVRSVLAQTYKNVEVIVVNDGGTPVEELLTFLNTRNNITYVRHGMNRERSAARNSGLRVARGKYVAYLDDDDVYYPDHVATLVDHAQTTGLKVVYSDAVRATQQKSETGEYTVTRKEITHAFEVTLDRLLVGNLVPILCLMHERSCLDETGYFDETLNSHEDWDLFIRLARSFTFGHVPKATCEYSWREDGSSTTSGNRADFIRTMELLYNRYRAEAAGRPDVLAAQERSLAFFAAEAGLQPVTHSAEKPKVSIIIPTFNKCELTRQCLEAIERTTTAVPYEVIVVDNASTDGTPDFLKREQAIGSLRAVLNPENLGFGKACNKAAAEARGEFLLFLNNDTVPHEGWLSALVNAAEADPSIGILGSRLLYPNGTIQHAGVVFTNERIPIHAWRGAEGRDSRVTASRDYPAVTGACLMISNDLFQQIGGYDDRFFMYVEDTDLCLSAWARGRSVRYCAESVVTHLESASVGSIDWSNQRVMEGIQKLHAKWEGRWPEAALRLSRPDLPADGLAVCSNGPAEASISWQAPLFDPSGYAEEARSFLLALENSGERVAAQPLKWSNRLVVLKASEEAQLLAMTARRVKPGGVHVNHIFPPSFTLREDAALNVGRTMFETDRLPEGWAAACNQMDRVWVPSEFNRQTFASAGVELDRIAVIPGTIDTGAYGPHVAPLTIEGARGFNFLSVFDWTLRKGWDILLRAYTEEFSADDDVALVLKVHSSLGYTTDQIAEQITRYLEGSLGRSLESVPDIILQDTNLAALQMPSLYRAADCFVLPSHGEGWGRPYMEAMASGLPVIGTNWSGNTEFMNDENSYLLACNVVEVPEAAWQETPTYRGHRWAEPDAAQLQRLMRRVFEDRAGAEAVGQWARAEIAERFSYVRVASIIQKEIAAALRSSGARDEQSLSATAA